MTITVAPSTWQPLARRLADELDADGDLHTPGWREALLAVPRHEFIPRYYLHDRVDRQTVTMTIELEVHTPDGRRR